MYTNCRILLMVNGISTTVSSVTVCSWWSTLFSASLVAGCRRSRAFLLEFSWRLPLPPAEVHLSLCGGYFHFWCKILFCIDQCVWSLWNIILPKLLLSVAFFIFWGSNSTHIILGKCTQGALGYQRGILVVVWQKNKFWQVNIMAKILQEGWWSQFELETKSEVLCRKHPGGLSGPFEISDSGVLSWNCHMRANQM